MTKDKKILYAAIITIFVLFIGIIFIISGLDNNTPKQDEFILNSDKFNLTYVSTIKENKFNGETLITSNDNNFTLNGTFVDGIFTSGYISLIDGDVSYYMDGDFQDFYIKEGTIIIRTADKTIVKKGFFKDNKLDGTGSMIIEDTKTGEVIFNYAGKFSSDYPQY